MKVNELNKKLQELAGIVTESSTGNSIEFHKDKFAYMIKTLKGLEKTLLAQNHIASAKSIGSIVGSMQQNKRLFNSAARRLSK